MGEETEQEKQERLMRERACKHNYRAIKWDYSVEIRCRTCGKQKAAYYWDYITEEQIKEWSCP